MMESRLVVCLLAWLFPLGCANQSPRNPEPVQAAVTGPPNYRHFDLPALAHYGGYVAGLSEEERITECNKLASGREGDVNSLPIRLHIAFNMMLTTGCGSPEQAMLILESIPDHELRGDVKGLIKYQVALAGRLIERLDHSDTLERRIGSLKKRTVSLNKRLKAKNSELNQLKTTLDALKKIEESFHQRSESSMR